MICFSLNGLLMCSRNHGLIPGNSNRFITFPKHPNWLWDPSVYSVGIRGFFSWSTVAGEWSWPLISMRCHDCTSTPPQATMTCTVAILPLSSWDSTLVCALWRRNCGLIPGSSKRFSSTAKLSRPGLGPTDLPVWLEPGPLAYLLISIHCRG